MHLLSVVCVCVVGYSCGERGQCGRCWPRGSCGKPRSYRVHRPLCTVQHRPVTAQHRIRRWATRAIPPRASGGSEWPHVSLTLSCVCVCVCVCSQSSGVPEEPAAVLADETDHPAEPGSVTSSTTADRQREPAAPAGRAGRYIPDGPNKKSIVSYVLSFISWCRKIHCLR